MENVECDNAFNLLNENEDTKVSNSEPSFEVEVLIIGTPLGESVK